MENKFDNIMIGRSNSGEKITMKLKQVKNVGESFIWENGNQEICACMIGQIAQALHPEGNPSGWNQIARSIADSVEGSYACLTMFSDGTRRCPPEDYEEVCTAYRERYPNLNLEFPEYESYLTKDLL